MLGRYAEILTPFTNHNIDLISGDIVYIFSDGYVDQFGGEKEKNSNPRYFAPSY
ncbi:MAG: hypothetical protein JKY48_16620 [Flavobacteriales bacterium]|nr:hypothetical protein [Flavobacteriales bacterium]